MTGHGIVVLISGGGTNLQAVIDGYQQQIISEPIVAVISNNADVKGLARATRAGIPAIVLDHRTFPDRNSYDQALAKLIARFTPKLVVLAGFMRILSPDFVQQFEGSMINIHPALLPEFKGLHTHARALESGAQNHGATVHFVTADLDDGPNIIQASLTVSKGDTEKTLAQRVLVLEHQILPMAIEWFLQNKISMSNNRCYLNQQQLDASGYVLDHDTH